MMAKRFSIEHFGYKVIAFLITLILWITVVSQREMVAEKNVQVQFVVPAEFEIQEPQQVVVTVKVEGPRPMVRRFFERYWPSTIVVPIRTPKEGPYPAEVPVAELQLPGDIKVLSIKPREVVLQIRRSIKKKD
jgi:YbbR domain-containing protein